MNLLEAYKNRLAVSEGYYAKEHQGAKLPESKKLIVAKCLESTNKFLNEAFENSQGTQRSDLGLWKKFALNLITTAVPNLISTDLVITYPMSSMSGYVNYVQYTTGSNKGAYTNDPADVLNDPFHLGSFKKDASGKLDINYTSSKVVEAKTAVSGAKKVEGNLNWLPVIPGTVEFVVGTTTYVDDGNGQIKIKDSTAVASSSIDYKTGKYSFDTTENASTAVFANYVYDNVVIPQNDLPIVNAQIKAIPLIAKARRVAIYFSQIAAFQAKTDYGMDLGKQLAEKAVGQLSYEIDTEVTQLLIDNATPSDELTFSKTLPVGVNMRDHYASFAEKLAKGSQIIYDRTKRFAANYILVASDLIPIFSLIDAFKAAPAGKMNGPYFAGTFNGLRVYVTPNIDPGKFVIGVNGDDMMSSAAVYAPYMPIVPTQLLGYADGGMSQGWSTLYDLKLLNANLLVAGKVVA